MWLDFILLPARKSKICSAVDMNIIWDTGIKQTHKLKNKVLETLRKPA